MKSGRAIGRRRGGSNPAGTSLEWAGAMSGTRVGIPETAEGWARRGNGERDANRDREPGEGSADRGCDGRETKRVGRGGGRAWARGVARAWKRTGQGPAMRGGVRFRPQGWIETNQGAVAYIGMVIEH
jgi:hypothetical protein